MLEIIAELKIKWFEIRLANLLTCEGLHYHQNMLAQHAS